MSIIRLFLTALVISATPAPLLPVISVEPPQIKGIATKTMILYQDHPVELGMLLLIGALGTTSGTAQRLDFQVAAPSFMSGRGRLK
jgi:hypothetical protein